MITETSLKRTSGPAAEPVTRAEAKKQLEIASADTTHDSAIDVMIIAARELVEHDTPYTCVNQTFTLSLTDFPTGDPSVVYLPRRPVQSITSVTYYDASEVQQTLATTVYGLDDSRRLVYLKYSQCWPDYTPLHDGVVVTFVAGYGSSAAAVPRLLRQAILVDVARQFKYRTGEPKSPDLDSTYTRIVERLIRSSYP